VASEVWQCMPVCTHELFLFADADDGHTALLIIIIIIIIMLIITITTTILLLLILITAYTLALP
jgi:hypothetical protein